MVELATPTFTWMQQAKHLAGRHDQSSHGHGGISVTHKKTNYGSLSTYKLDDVPGSELQVTANKHGERSVATFLLPEASRGKGLGQQMLLRALEDGPIAVESSGGVSAAYRRVQDTLQRKHQIEVFTDDFDAKRMRLPSKDALQADPFTKALSDIPADDAFWAEVETDLALAMLKLNGRAHAMGIEAAESLGVNVDFDAIHTQALEATRRATFDMVKKITGTTRDGLREALIAWQETGAVVPGKKPRGLPSLIAGLEPLFGKERAKRIAQTETTRLFAQGNETAGRDDETIGGYQFQASNDEKVCPICGGRDNNIYPKGTTAQRPPAHVRCRCGWIPTSWRYIRRNPAKWQGDPASIPPQEVWETGPEVAATVSSDVNIRDDSATTKGHLQDLRKLPDALRQEIAAAGYRWDIGNLPLTELDDNLEYRGVTPRGWEGTGYTWDKVAGGLSTRTKTICAGAGVHGSSSLLLHETGHAIDHVRGIARSRTMRDHHHRLFSKLPPYMQQGGAGGYAGCQETFAEALAERLALGRATAANHYDIRFINWMEQELGL